MNAPAPILAALAAPEPEVEILPAERYDVPVPSDHSAGIRRLVRLGLGAVATLILGFCGLVALLPMAGAVIAPGEVTVETHVKEISHPYGGVASQILVKEGDAVHKGQVLVRLDDSVAGALATYAGEGLDQLLARAARLRAIQNGWDRVHFPRELLARSADPSVRGVMNDERASFALGYRARLDQIGQLQARVAQSQSDSATYLSQLQAYGEQEGLIRQELDQTRDLYKDRLTTLDRLNALERSAVGVRAQREAAQAGLDQARARIGELQVQMTGVTSQARSDAALELGQVEAAISERRKDSAETRDRADRTAIRAPQDGVVDKLRVRTLGSVVPAGETLMEIVPKADRLVVRVQIRPTDIDQVAVGRKAHIRFSALNMRTTPELTGTVTQVAADSTVNQSSGIAFYPATVSIPDEEFRKLESARISVGMPVEVFVQTQQRTILQYIIRPLSDQFRRALRE
ncbi:HlyD family type I secretion periplasmic adaptor subunit [Novosphingobium sp. 1949]|uniref:Membrane fusion protein (MFP) family protein n=1 Tax=Novosphingobium organovorum TaxID=2930092 RepID=A0ABT0BE11_9SPHN|nr:HlyD family type I secretion periplasmic adaptor subunit [Novosphingobium organovorum]MCJ2183292.1 HlyD family type I secretion periplasmic adaptor subunit [Novosphingobium organovorum]